MPNKYANRAEAEHRIDLFLNSSDVAPHSTEFADTKAVHVAIDTVADIHYGGERGNEIFFLYPVAFVAANYQIDTQRLVVPDKFTPDDVHISSQFNDYWLMQRESMKGELPIDASIVFLPGEAQVDSKTGSRYQIDEDGKPVSNIDQMKKMLELVRSEEFAIIADVFKDQLNELQDLRLKKRRLIQEANEIDRIGSRYEAEKKREQAKEVGHHIGTIIDSMDPARKLIISRGITDPRFLKIIEEGGRLEPEGLRELLSYAHNDYQFNDSDPIRRMKIEDTFRKMGLQFKLAENTISSQQCWEAYFKKTGKRPSKVIYYEQETPNEAFREFRVRAGLNEDGLHQQIDLKKIFARNLQGNLHGEIEHERDLFEKYATEVLDDLFPRERVDELKPDPISVKGLFAGALGSLSNEEMEAAMNRGWDELK
ncbi:MAG: hypothetical protein Q8P90_01905 [bacterium]|nr:hypothetical protein [bacterium]